jgi:hypothetical protein
MILSPAQIAQYAAAAGFTGNDLATAVAIALAESNPPGNTQSYNPETAAPGGTPTGQGSYGLWQIYLKMHPEFAGEDLYDPQVNANAAFSIYAIAGNNFHPWSTYTNGTYGMYLQPANPAAPAPLTLDASTGLPVSDLFTSEPVPAALPTMMATIDPTMLAPASALSIGTVLLWGALGIFALWLFEEAM